MTFGPDEVLLCRYCRQIFSRNTLASGNTFGSVSWSDGDSLMPMMPQGPLIIRCTNCNKAFFTEDARPVGFVPLGTFMDEPFQIDSFDSMSLDDFRGFLEDRLHEGNPERELQLRLSIWRRSNDKQRGLPTGQQPEITEEFRENLERICVLLENREGADAVLTVAEIKRELGDFQAAEVLLSELIEEYKDDIFNEYIAVTADEMRTEVLKKNTAVFRLRGNDETDYEAPPEIPPAGGLADI